MRERVTWQEDETQGYTNPYNLTPPFVLPWAENIQAADSGAAPGRASLGGVHRTAL